MSYARTVIRKHTQAEARNKEVEALKVTIKEAGERLHEIELADRVAEATKLVGKFYASRDKEGTHYVHVYGVDVGSGMCILRCFFLPKSLENWHASFSTQETLWAHTIPQVYKPCTRETYRKGFAAFDRVLQVEMRV